MKVKEKDLMLRFLDLLGSKWAKNEKRFNIREYACNEFFDLTSDIDVILMFMPKNHPKRKAFLKAKEIITLKGNAFWIGTRDILTNLAIKTGGVGKELEW